MKMQELSGCINFNFRLQMAKNEEKKMQEKREAEREGELLKAEQEAQRRKIELIKKEKLRELEQLGIPDKYKTDLAHKKII